MIRVCQFMYAFPLLVSTVCRHFGGGFRASGGTSDESRYRTGGRFGAGGSFPDVHGTFPPLACGYLALSSPALSQHSRVLGCHTHRSHASSSAHDSQHASAVG
jgi:hypothetical protein